METKKAIIERKSVRAYSSEQIKDEELNALLTVANTAPVAGGAYKTMHLTVVQNPDILTKIREMYQSASGAKSDVLYGAPTLIIVSGKRDFDETALFANVGCIIENMSLAAYDMGLGSVFSWATGTILPTQTELVKELGISDDFKPLAGLAVGYPAKELPKRVKMSEIETNYIR